VFFLTHVGGFSPFNDALGFSAMPTFTCSPTFHNFAAINIQDCDHSLIANPIKNPPCPDRNYCASALSSEPTTYDPEILSRGFCPQKDEEIQISICKARPVACGDIICNNWVFLKSTPCQTRETAFRAKVVFTSKLSIAKLMIPMQPFALVPLRDRCLCCIKFGCPPPSRYV
jgi:hypothetical protein